MSADDGTDSGLDWLAETARARPRSSEPPTSAPPQQRFEELAELGRGGMGRVVEAYDRALDRTVAIKQALDLEPGLAARFAREVRIGARLQHPGIVAVLDAGRDADGRAYFVMPKVAGRPLADLIAGAASVRARLALVPNLVAAVDAIAYAHAQGIVHRDLKPANVLVGAFGETLVIDWGLACAVDEAAAPAGQAGGSLTRAGHAYGTPGYMAPEQARGESSDPRSDVYALGATLYHVLAGSPRYAELGEPSAVIAAVARGEPIALALADEVPAELGAIAAKAMAGDAAARYADAGELAADLRRFLTGQLVAAHRYTARQRLARWIARHRIAVAVGAIALVLLATVGSLALHGVLVARDAARDAAEREGTRADEALLESARMIALSDPTRAAAMLKQMPATSPVWHRARDVVETVLAAGPSRGVAAAIADPRFSSLAPAPNGKTYAYTSGGDIFVGEPSLRAPANRIAALSAAPTLLLWAGDGSLVAMVERHLVHIDCATGALRTLDSGGPVDDAVTEPATHRVFARAGGHVRELDLGGGVPRADLGDAIGELHRVRGGVVFRSTTDVVFVPDDRPAIVVAQGAHLSWLSASLEGPLRIAVLDYADHERIREFELGAGGFVLRATWEADRDITMLEYIDDRLVAMQYTRLAWLAPGKPLVWTDLPVGHDGRVDGTLTLIPYRWGVIVVGWEHLLFVAYDRPAVAFATYPERLANTVRVGDYLVGLTSHGDVRSWRLADVLPQLLGTYADATLGYVDHQVAWFGDLVQRDGTTGIRLDLATGKMEGFASSAATAFLCHRGDQAVFAIAAGIHLPKNEPAPLEVMVDTTNQHHELSRSALRFGCDESAGILVEASATEVAVRRLTDLDHVALRFPLAAPPRGIALSAGFVAALDTAGTLTRFSLTTGARDTTPVPEPPDAFALADTGEIAFTHGNRLALWPLHGERVTLESFPTKLLLASPLGFVAMTQAEELVVIARDGTRHGRYPIARAGLWIPQRSTTAFVQDTTGRVALLDLRDGSIASLPWRADQIVSSADGNVAILRDTMNTALLVLRRRTIDNPYQMRGALEAATNATIEPGATAVAW